MRIIAACDPTSYDRRPYRTQPVLVNAYSKEEFASPATFRWWIASTLLGFTEAHTQIYKLEAPGDVMVLIVDPNDTLGAHVLSQFSYLGEPLPKRHRQRDCGHVGPAVVIPCDLNYALGVLRKFDRGIGSYLSTPLDRGRTWLAVAAAGGISAFDAPIEQELVRHDDTARTLIQRYEMRVQPGPVPVAIL